jgi:outer membrane protein OmpA-like peptidoglycan-associated protein
MKLQSTIVLSAILVAALAMQGCATPQSPPKFPDASSATSAGGTFVNIANLRNVDKGLNKDQMYDLLGPPHFDEWFVGNHVWNYLFNLRRGNEVITCQYQVQFDKNMKVSNTYWRDPACADLVRGTPAATPVAKETVEPPPIEDFSIESEALFPFGKSTAASMLPKGRAQLDAVIAKIRTHDDVSRIDVVGHTDRIGAEAVNQPLSVARAETVRQYLSGHGLDLQLVHAQGVGSSQPVTHCPAGESAAVIACLQPDRRVSITVSGRR